MAVSLSVAALHAGESPSADGPEVTPAQQRAIERGLGWLASTQKSDGSWPGDYGDTPGLVGFAVLAWIAGGSTPGRGQHGREVARAIDWLLSKQASDGLFFQDGMNGAPMYHHGTAVLALCEAYGQTRDQRLGPAIKKGVRLILGAQHPKKGSWRYQPNSADDDLSATVVQLMALRAARDVDMFVPKDVIDRGLAYVKTCHNPFDKNGDGGFAYQPGKSSGFGTTAIGITALQLAGDYQAIEIKDALEYMLQFQPFGRKGVFQFWFYGHYYGAQAVYQSQSIAAWGRKAWRLYYPALVNDLVARQHGDGSWQGGSGPLNTTLGVLMLTVPYRYLPVYQR